jgi:hypothetical protein
MPADEVSPLAVGDLTPKEPTTTLDEATAAGYLGVPTDESDDYVYTLAGVSGIPKPDPGL